MKKIAAPKELFSRAWTALKATWKIVLPLVAAIQLAAYVLSRLVGLIPGVAGTILSFATSALIMVPTVGVMNGVLGYFRGKTLTYDCVESMMPHAMKIIGLYLWTMLCIFAWMLPGMGGVLVGTVLMAFAQKALLLGILGSLLIIAGIIAMIVLAFRVSFSYSMYTCILIDEPATLVWDILKKSKTMMQGYRWHYFKVGLPVFVGVLVIALVVGLLMEVLPLWLNSLISTAMGVVTATMSQYLLPVMYEELKRIGR